MEWICAEQSCGRGMSANKRKNLALIRNHQRRERWPKELAVEQEVIEPEEVKANPEAFRCIGEEVTEILDYRPAQFFRHQIKTPGEQTPREFSILPLRIDHRS
jgi:hypothetical protein